MRLTKGSKVEVLIHEEAATGGCAWRSAEVISGNGRTYVVKYYLFRSNTEVVDEKIPRKFIRPRPPPVSGMDSLVRGDILEVFYNDLWRTSTLVELISANIFSVRLLGSSDKLKAYKSQLRIPQHWENGEWFVPGQSAIGSSMVQNTVEDQRPHVISSKRLRLRIKDVPTSEKVAQQMIVLFQNLVYQLMLLVVHPLLVVVVLTKTSTLVL